MSGLTKWTYFQNDQLDTLYFLFEDYNVPFLSTQIAAQLATFGELVLPIMLILGIGTQISAVGLLIMSAVIYSVDQNYDTSYWAAILIYLLVYGGGFVTLDHVIGRMINKNDENIKN